MMRRRKIEVRIFSFVVIRWPGRELALTVFLANLWQKTLIS